MTSSPSRNRAKGYRAERELVYYLRQKGWAAWRIPTSASSSETLPDVVAVKDADLVAFEVKYRTREDGKAVVRVSKEQIDKLSRFLDAFTLYNRHAIVALRVRGKWVFKPASGDGIKVSDDDRDGWSP
ncbi:MAG: hypothetical protein ACP5T5_04920 [Thermoprotei archaeon]|nr:hypothetical protein [TACK group archaeon]